MGNLGLKHSANVLLEFVRGDNIIIFFLRATIYTALGLLIFIAPHEILIKMKFDDDLSKNFAAIFSFLLLVAFTWLYRTKMEGRVWRSIGIAIADLRIADLVIGLIVGLASFGFILFEMDVSGSGQFSQQIYNNLDVKPFLASLIFYFFQPAIEEVLFRGYLCNAFSERFNAIVSCLFVGIVFGFLHQDTPGFGPVMMYNAVAMTSCMYFARLATGSLLWPIGWHMGWNFFQDYSSDRGLFVTDIFPESTVTLSIILTVSTIILIYYVNSKNISIFKNLKLE